MFRMWFEMHPHIARCCGCFKQKFGQNISTHFKLRGTNCRTQPSLNLMRTLLTHHTYGRLQHPINQAAPTSMCGTNDPSIPTGKQYRQAIRSHHHTHLPTLSQYHRIGFGWWRIVLIPIVGLHINNRAVGLIQPQRLIG